MSGSENITLHYSFRGNAVQQFGNLDSDTGGTTNMTDSCGTVGSSTCRQNYSWSNAATVFMYRYTGPDVRIIILTSGPVYLYIKTVAAFDHE